MEEGATETDERLCAGGNGRLWGWEEIELAGELRC